jgi:hypothetical protein
MVTSVELSLVALLSFVAYRRRRDRLWALLVMLCAGGLILLLLTGRLATRPTFGLAEAAGVLLTAVIAAEAFGLPTPIARRVGVGLRSKEWEFDRTLAHLLRQLNGEIERAQAASQIEPGLAWRERLRHAGQRGLARLIRLRAPDDNWADLAKLYARIYEDLIDVYVGERGDTMEAEIAERSSLAAAERARLRAQYKAEIERLGAGRVARLVRGRR